MALRPLITRSFPVMITAGILLLLFPALAKAQTVYTYTGHSFTTFGESAAPGSFDSSHYVSARVVLSAPLAPNTPLARVTPVSLTLSNGRCSILGTNSFFVGVSLSTDASGNVADWSFSGDRIQGYPACRIASNRQSDTGVIFSSYYWDGDQDTARVDNSPGTWTVFSTPLTNVALAANGGVATASSTFDNAAFAPSGAIDGDRKGTAWGSNGGWNDGTQDAFPDWLEVAFSEKKAIQQIDVFTVQDNYNSPIDPTLTTTFSLYGLRNFRAQYWDGFDWITVPGGNLIGNNRVWREFTFSPVYTSKIRIQVDDAPNHYSRITEVEAWATDNVAPTTQVLSPFSTISFGPAPATVSLSASASDADGSISKVDFYAGRVLIATSTSLTSPFTAVWNNVPPGIYEITSVATDNRGLTTQSAPETILVRDDGLMNVALASNGAVAIVSSTFGSGYSPLGAIDGSRAGAPWGAGGGWQDASEGTFPDWLEVDFAGVRSIQEIDVFSLHDNYTSGANFPTSFQTFSLYGLTDFQVQYWTGSDWLDVQGGFVTGNNLVWRKVTFPAVSTSKIRVLVNGALNGYSRIVEIEAWTFPTSVYPPSISLETPLGGQTFNAPATVQLSVFANKLNGFFGEVKYYANGNLIAVSTTDAKYPATWANVPAGTYAITAIGTDFQGGKASSGPITIVVTGVAMTNFALASNGGSVIASSTYSNGYPPVSTIDGDRKGVSWGAGGGWNDGTLDAFPDWLEVHFNGVKAIQEIDVFTIQNNYTTPSEPTPLMTSVLYGLRDFQVEYWTGFEWLNVPGGTVTGNNLVWRKFAFSPIFTSKIRLFVLAALNGYSRVTEIEAWGEPSALVNLARPSNGGSVTASSSFSNDFSASGAVDGDRKGSSWGAGGGWNDGTADDFPDWLEVAFNGVKSIQEIDVFTVQDDYSSPIDPTASMTFSLYGLRSFLVQYWTGTEWLNVPGGNVLGSNLVWRKFSFEPLSTPKIRIYVEGALNGYSRITEVEVYGTP